MEKEKIQEAYENMLNEMVSTTDIKTLGRRVKEIEAVVKVGESPFELLSSLKFDIEKLMKKVM